MHKRVRIPCVLVIVRCQLPEWLPESRSLASGEGYSRSLRVDADDSRDRRYDDFFGPDVHRNKPLDFFGKLRGVELIAKFKAYCRVQV